MSITFNYVHNHHNITNETISRLSLLGFILFFFCDELIKKKQNLFIIRSDK